MSIAPEEGAGYARTLAALRDELGTGAIDELHAAGHAMPFGDAVEEALGAVRD